MDTNQVNKSRRVSPIFGVRIPHEYKPLVVAAANIATDGNISSFIRKSAIKAAREVVEYHTERTTEAQAQEVQS